MGLSNKELESIIKPLKDQRFRNIKKDSKDILDRVSRLRKNLFISGGAIFIIVMAGIKIDRINLLFAQGTIDYPFVIPLSLGVVFIYYFLMYSLNINSIKKTLNLNSIKESYTYNVAQEVLKLKVNRYFSSSKFENFDDKTKPRVGSTQLLSFNRIDNVVISFNLLSGSQSYESFYDEPDFYKRGKDNVLKFSYTLSENDSRIFIKGFPFLKKMSWIMRMDYLIPLWFGWFVIFGVFIKYLNQIFDFFACALS
ncbi:MAG: hypothetical protein ABJH98_04080 [Reichenbachiella sp.]|uniref:hypothetical protein n=1 Tax=Reichenbachiella sp. TaxID=2184521 RepID=UPI003296C894